MPKQSLNEKALGYMQKIYDRDPKYFESKSNQREARRGFNDLYQLDQEKGNDIWNHRFPKFLRKNKLKKEDFIKTRFIPNIPKSEINAKTTSKPSGITEKAKSAGEEIKEDILHEHPQLASRDEQEIDSDLENLEQASHLIPVESISIFWDGVWHLMKLKWSMIAPLTPQERESLGKMWQPFFQNYASEKFIFLVIPTIMTFGILAPKVIKGRKLHKEAQEKKKKEKTQEKEEGSE